MAKLESSHDSTDKEKYIIVSEELKRFNNLVKGHRKILEAIAKL